MSQAMTTSFCSGPSRPRSCKRLRFAKAVAPILFIFGNRLQGEERELARSSRYFFLATRSICKMITQYCTQYLCTEINFAQVELNKCT